MIPRPMDPEIPQVAGHLMGWGRKGVCERTSYITLSQKDTWENWVNGKTCVMPMLSCAFHFREFTGECLDFTGECVACVACVACLFRVGELDDMQHVHLGRRRLGKIHDPHGDGEPVRHRHGALASKREEVFGQPRGQGHRDRDRYGDRVWARTCKAFDEPG